MTLASQILHSASPRGERIVLLHGFTQNSQCWEPFASHLAELMDMEIVALDAPGHGRTSSEHDSADLWESASLVAQAGGHAHYVGYSMGGRTALHLALLEPNLVHSLTLIGATPGIADEHDRAARLAADIALAERLEVIGVPAFVDQWLDQPMFSGLTATTAHKDARLQNRAAGLAASLRNCGTGAQEDLRTRLTGLLSPTLVVVGELDLKFAALGEELPGVLQRIVGTGHTAHLERPRLTAEAASRFMRSVSESAHQPPR